MGRAFTLGALDVVVTPVQMKKNRPGVVLTILCEPQALEAMIDVVLTETTTLGVRYYEANRRVLQRSLEVVRTDYGDVRMKVAGDGSRVLQARPEYEDIAKIAEESGVPLLEVQAAAMAAYSEKVKRENGKRNKE
jgi:pyridinium-3,5-bisthiocarboxylic acid mononucleotide nickel chelatase